MRRSSRGALRKPGRSLSIPLAANSTSSGGAKASTTSTRDSSAIAARAQPMRRGGATTIQGAVHPAARARAMTALRLKVTLPGPMTVADDVADEHYGGGHRALAMTFAAILNEEARALVEPQGEIIDLGLGEVILERGRQVESSLFPYGSTMISMVVDVDGRSIEVASVGDEGAVGGIISCGHAPAYTRADVLVAGPALRLPMEARRTCS